MKTGLPFLANIDVASWNDDCCERAFITRSSLEWANANAKTLRMFNVSYGLF